MASIAILICIAVLFLYSLFKVVKNVLPSSTPNPFAQDSRKPVKEKVLDQKLRDSVLKQGFNFDKVPSSLDAIVIGSGIGGLSTAVILGKAGKKVLVLEQHDQAGGCCHTFIEKGYEFDVGIHYIGDMNRQTVTKTYLDQISDGQIEWEDLSDDFDHVIFDSLNKDKKREYSIMAGIERQKSNLKKYFPKEDKAIDRFYELLIEIRRSYHGSLVIKFLPLWMVWALNKLCLLKLFTNFWTWNEKTAKEVIGELTSNQDLRDLFCYCFGDYGTVPSKCGFSFNSLLMAHFAKGASYPVGGASEIAHSIIPIIEKSGGKVFVRAKVTEILTELGSVRGVRVAHGTKTHDLFAPLIISDAGVYNTFEKILPKGMAYSSKIWPLIKSLPHGSGSISVFIGMDATAEELNIKPKTNYWIFTDNDIDKISVDYLNLSKEEFMNADIPLLFVSFPSTKDPTWDQRYPGKTAMVCITLANYDWYASWAKNPTTRRGDDYEALKKTIGDKIIQQCSKIFPNIEEHIDYINVGSPLSNNFYLGSPKGEIYGLDHTSSRFSPMSSSLLRPKTDIPGLYLTGQDVFSCGFIGALWGGLLCAQQILGRNLVRDIASLHKSLSKSKKTQ